MTAPQATPACAIGLPGSFTGVSELEVPHAVAGPIAARNDLARCGPLQRQRFWRRRGQPRPDLGLVVRMTGIVAPADKVRLGAAPRGARKTFRRPRPWRLPEPRRRPCQTMCPPPAQSRQSTAAVCNTSTPAVRLFPTNVSSESAAMNSAAGHDGRAAPTPVDGGSFMGP